MIRYHLCKTELQAPASTPEGRRRWVVDCHDTPSYSLQNKTASHYARGSRKKTHSGFCIVFCLTSYAWLNAMGILAKTSLISTSKSS